MKTFLFMACVLYALCQILILVFISISIFLNRVGDCKIRIYREVQKKYPWWEMVYDYFRLREVRLTLFMTILHLCVCIPAMIVLGRYFWG